MNDNVVTIERLYRVEEFARTVRDKLKEKYPYARIRVNVDYNIKDEIEGYWVYAKVNIYDADYNYNCLDQTTLEDFLLQIEREVQK